MVKKLLAIVISILFFSISVNAQRNKIWYFGAKAGLNSSTGAQLTNANTGFTADEGVATACDINGNLLFYTDGAKVYDNTHTVMPNGTGLLLSSSTTQGALIVPMPCNANKYYVFKNDVDYSVNSTNPGGGNVQYSIVDMTLNSGKGDVIPASKNTALITNDKSIQEKMALAPHANGTDYWICFYKRNSGTGTFLAYQVTSTGVSSTPVSTALGTSSNSGFGEMKFSACGSKVALVEHGNGTQAQVMDFNSATGVVSNRKNLPGSGTRPYGVAFSASGQYVYICEIVTPNIYKYDVSVASPTATSISGGAGWGGSVQLGADNNIYVANKNAFSITKITNPEAATPTISSITLSNWCYYGLPNPIPTHCCTSRLITADITDQTICAPGNVTYTPTTVAMTCSTFVWKVSTNGGTTWSTLSDGGVYSGTTTTSLAITGATVSMNGYKYKIIITNGSCKDSSEAFLYVKAKPTATISGTTAICSGNSTNLSVALTGTQPWSISYSDGTTTTSITGITASPYTISVSPTSTKTYTLSTVSDVNCTGTVSGSAVITVNPRPTATISGGGAVCLGNSTNLSVALTGTQPWSISYSDGTTTTNITGITSSPYSISVSPTANKTYTLSAVNDANCTGSVFGSATVTINPKPTATISGSTVLCTGNSTNLSVALTGSPNWTITYTDGTTPVTISGITSSPYLISVSPTSTKTYTLTAVSDLNCTGTFSGTALVTVNAKPTATISGTSPLCNGASTNLSVVFTGLQPWSITYTDGTTPVTITGITTSPYNIPVSPTSNKTYSLTAVSDVNCAGTVSGSAVITVSNRPTATISGTTAICIGASTNISVALTGTPNWTITYTDGTTPVTVSEITTSPYVISVSPTSTKTYTVTAVNDANCTGTVSGSAEVTVNTKPTAVISGGATYCIGGTTNLSVALTGAQPWSVTYFDGTTSTTVTGITASPFVFAVSPTSTKTYTITAVSDANCTGTFSGSATVTVNPKPTASISGNSTICNGQSANLNVVLTGTPNWNITYTDGTVSTTINGITASPYTIAVSPISTKTYTITAVSDANCTGTSFTGSATVTVNPKPTAVISGTTSICSGASTNLSVALTGTPNWTITYTDGTTPVTISGITSSPYLIPVTTTTNKTYTLTALSDVNCVGTSFTGSAIITINPKPTATISGTTAICAGASTNLSVALTGTPNWTITYTDGTTPVTVSGITSTPYIISVSPASTTSYTITAVADANCTGTFSGTAIVTINPKPTATLSGTNAICIGASSNLSVALTGTPNWTITYTDGTMPVTISGITSSPYLIPVSPTSTKTYSLLTVTDANCSGTFSGTATVTVNPKPTAIISGTIPICIGASTNLSVALTGNQPWTITYTDGTTPVTISGITASPYLISVSPTSTKTYTLTAVSDVNCVGTSFTGSATVTVNPKPTATITGTNAICIGASTNLSVALTGNQPWSITYTDGTTPVTISGITASPYIISVSPTSTTNYSLTAVSDVNCTGTFSGTATVTVNPKPTATISGTTPICIGGSTNLSVALTGNQPWTITYTDGTTPVTISGITASPYLISVSPASIKHIL